MNQDRTKRKLTAILSADVVGYSRLMEADEAWTIKNLDENKRLIGKLIEEYEGRVIDAIGDNLLAEFNSVINSVECAVKIQQELKKINDTLVEERKMHFRIGVNLGDVVEEDGRIYGSGVNIASRLEGLAEPGGICISGRTYDHIKTRLGLGYNYLGEHNVKNIDEPIRIYRLLMDSENIGKVIGEKKAPSRSSYRIGMAAIIILIIIAAGLLFWNIYSHQSRKIEPASIEPEKAPAMSEMEEGPKTIAVLPFVNLSPDPDQEYFVDGLTEELLNSLTKISDLRVIARTSSFTFKGSDKNVQEIANILGADHILEGSVRKAGNALRITAQLIHAMDGIHLWSETYDRELKDIFAVQEDIATAVANELKVTLGIDRSRRQLGGTDNLEAYELYLVAKGQYKDTKYNQALESIDGAIALDSEFALAWALKGLIHYWLGAGLPKDEDILEGDKAIEAELKAIEIEPNLGKAWLMLGTIRNVSRDFIEAQRYYDKGMALTTESIDYFEYGLTLHYWSVGYLRKCHKLLEELRQNDPLHKLVRASYMLILGYLGDVQGAEDEYKRCKAIFDQWFLGDHFITILRLGTKNDSSINDIPESQTIYPVLKHLNSPKEGLEELRRLDSSDSDLTANDFFFMANLAAYFGDPELSMDYWEKTPGTSVYSWNPVMHEVRQLSRFKEFIKEIGIVDYWKKYGWPDNNICRQVGDDDFVCD